jgi:hypothetical protein
VIPYQALRPHSARVADTDDEDAFVVETHLLVMGLTANRSKGETIGVRGKFDQKVLHKKCVAQN